MRVLLLVPYRIKTKLSFKRVFIPCGGCCLGQGIFVVVTATVVKLCLSKLLGGAGMEGTDFLFISILAFVTAIPKYLIIATIVLKQYSCPAEV
jgi:hypothetical protein